MWFTRVISFIALLLAFGAFVLAKPVVTVAVKTRGDGISLEDVENVLMVLSAEADEILSQIIPSPEDTASVTLDSLGRLLDQLITVLIDAEESLDAIVPASSDASDSTVVTLVANIVNEIVSSLEPVTGLLTVSYIQNTLSNLDITLSQVLTDVNALLGVISSVTPLVSALSGTLALLGLDETRAALGL